MIISKLCKKKICDKIILVNYFEKFLGLFEFNNMLNVILKYLIFLIINKMFLIIL